MTLTRNELYLLVGGLVLVAAIYGGGVVLSESQNKAKWTPALSAAEQKYGLPRGLLVAQAQQESSFSSDVISGTRASSAGALGILQLEPAYFSSVRNPIPFSDAAVAQQIDQAGANMLQLYEQFGSWTWALAAYNWGSGNVSAFQSGNIDTIPDETQTYVANITAAVPAADDAVLS